MAPVLAVALALLVPRAGGDHAELFRQRDGGDQAVPAAQVESVTQFRLGDHAAAVPAHVQVEQLRHGDRAAAAPAEQVGLFRHGDGTLCFRIPMIFALPNSSVLLTFSEARN